MICYDTSVIQVLEYVVPRIKYSGVVVSGRLLLLHAQNSCEEEERVLRVGFEYPEFCVAHLDTAAAVCV